MPKTRTQARSAADALELQACEFETTFQHLRHAHRGKIRKLKQKIQDLEQQLDERNTKIQELEAAKHDLIHKNWALTTMIQGNRYMPFLCCLFPGIYLRTLTLMLILYREVKRLNRELLEAEDTIQDLQTECDDLRRQLEGRFFCALGALALVVLTLFFAHTWNRRLKLLRVVRGNNHNSCTF